MKLHDEPLKILGIDDEPKNMPAMLGPLTDYGFHLMAALSGEDGLRIAQENQPDLILLDIIMPGMNGYEVCHLLKADQRTKEIPVIFLTALDDVESKLQGFDAGGIDYLVKPVDPRELLARVTSHLDRHRLYLRLRDRLENHRQQDNGEDESQPLEADMERIRMVSEYLMRHLEQEPSLDELARMAATNRTSLNQQFQILYGSTVFDWLREQRLVKASLLLAADRPVSEISQSVGYASSSAFSQAFRNRFSVTPREYRERAKRAS